MTAVVIPLPNIWGASAEDWNHFDVMLGLGEDLLPVVSNPHVTIAESSKLKSLGKVPSVYNRKREVVGLVNWTVRCTTQAEIEGWMAERDYGICVQTRHCRAIDIDVPDAAKAARLALWWEKALGCSLPTRSREDSGKRLLALRVEGEIPKIRVFVDGGVVEFLGNGQQFIAVGTHPEGKRYRWEGGLPNDIPSVTMTAYRELIAEFAEAFATAPVAEGKLAGEDAARLDIDDPIADWLEGRGLVLREDPRGLVVACPWADEHTSGEEGDGSTMWLTAGGRGKPEGHFRCLHAHCEGRTRREYLEAVGYVEDVASQFEDLGPEEPDVPLAEMVAAEAAKQRPKISVASFADLLADEGPEEPDYIEPGFLGPSNFCLIAGPPKAQKSFLLQEMLIAAATGSTFLAGTFTVPRPLKVFYVQAEMNRKLLRKRAQMVGDALSDEHKALLHANFRVTDRFAMLLDAKGVIDTARAISEAFPGAGPDIIAFDPLANLFDGESEDKAADVMRFLTQRIEAVRQKVNPKAAVVLVHHATKRNADDMERDPFVAIRGSGALRGYYDTGVVVFRKADDAPDRRVFFELRAGESPEPMTIRLNAFGMFEKVEGEEGRVAGRGKRRKPGAWEAAVMVAYEELSMGGAMVMKPALIAKAVESRGPEALAAGWKSKQNCERAVAKLVKDRVLADEKGAIFALED